MGATEPRKDLSGFISSMTEGIHGAFNRGVKYGRYLEQQEKKLRAERERDALLFDLTQLAMGFGDECDCCRFCESDGVVGVCKRAEILAEENGGDIEGGTLICVWEWRGLCEDNGGGASNEKQGLCGALRGAARQ